MAGLARRGRKYFGFWLMEYTNSLRKNVFLKTNIKKIPPAAGCQNVIPQGFSAELATQAGGLGRISLSNSLTR